MEPGYPMRYIVSAGIAVFVLGFIGPSSTYGSANGQTVPPAHSRDISDGTREEGVKEPFLRILPDASAMIEAAGAAGSDYTFQTRRQVALDLLMLGNWFFHFDITEGDLFDPSPSQIDHEFQYLGIGRETARGDRITLFWDHTCYNPTRELPEDEYNSIHWHEVGLAYETLGMRFGHENDELEFDAESEWLHSIQWKASFSKVGKITDNDYEYMLKLDIRDDIYRYGRHVFYAQLDLDSIYDDRGIQVNPRLEIGDRIRLNRNTRMVPFLSYQRFHDWYDLGEGEEFFLAGVRIEGNIGGETDTGDRVKSGSGEPDPESGQEATPDRQSPQDRYLTWTPRLRVDGGYASVVDSDDYGFSSDVAIDLDFLEWNSNTLTLNTFTGVLTPPDDLVPNIIQYAVGASLNTDWGDTVPGSDSRVFYSYSCLYGIDDTHRIRDYSLVGLELSHDASNWNWGARFGVYPATTGYDYWGDVLASVSYDFLREGIIPYVGCAGRYLPGDDSELGYAAETGVRIPGERGVLRIYVRWQDDFNIFKFGRGEQTMIGFRLLFS
jgi:hypothetical protein